MTATPAAAPVLRVLAPAHRQPELAWVCGVLFDRWLGLPAEVRVQPGPDVVVQVLDGGRVAAEVCWTDVFLAAADARWGQPDTLPPVPPPMWPLPDPALAARVGEPSLARLFGDGRFTHDLQGDVPRLRLPLDVTGSAFFLLSRYEEDVAGAARDRHGRFPGAASVAHRAGLALRPLVDEWVEALWWALQQVAPGLQRRPRQARTWVSCDVDAPFSGTGLRGLRQAASALVNDRSLRGAAGALLNTVARPLGVRRFDAYDCFDWMLDANERAGQRLSCFFLALARPAAVDGHYTLGQPAVAALLRSLVARGHEVGLHGSYRSVDDAVLQARERDALRAAVAAAGGDAAEVLGARQHYLRWRGAHSARQVDALGFRYDSTLDFSDVAGFRCGTCHAYPMFDLAARRPLALLQRPLVLMEVTVASPVYLGLGYGDAAAALMHGLRARCRRFGGEFSLLWHNSNLGSPEARALYRSLLADA